MKGYKYNFKAYLKLFPLEGHLVYEYNPFYNYRLTKDMIFYKNRLWDLEKEEDMIEFLQFSSNTKVFWDKNTNQVNWGNVSKFEDLGFPKYETPPVLYQKGLLVDFCTNELLFDLNHPVNILPLYSYDNSVNLIINDGISSPKLINSRFSATERNQYQVCDRRGNNDTNIYNQGESFDYDVSLYKKVLAVPTLTLLAVTTGGNLQVGNYHFYFRYTDDDGNQSDFFSESGLVSIFIGESADSIHTGLRDENAHKLVKFMLEDVDSSYTKIEVYYTKATGDVLSESIIDVRKIARTYPIQSKELTTIIITGYEDTIPSSIAEINQTYQIYGSVETLANVQNRLFLGNCDRVKVNDEDLQDCALRILPTFISSEEYNINLIGNDYSLSVVNTYYDPLYIYDRVGYHYDEIYRFGVVFIFNDNSLSSVYNVRGSIELPSCDDETSEELIKNAYTYYKFKENDSRKYIPYNLSTYKINEKENAKGTVYIPKLDFRKVIGMLFYVPEEVINYLKTECNIKGLFFVRLKRIPTTICLATTIGIDRCSHTPVIPGDSECSYYITESFISRQSEVESRDRLLTHNFEDRKIELDPTRVAADCGICPEYDIDYPRLNNLFTGTDFTIQEDSKLSLDIQDNHFVLTPEDSLNAMHNVKILGVEDNVKLVAINNYYYAASIGEAEEAYRFGYAGIENKSDQYADNLLRGSYGPYLGLAGFNEPLVLINIKIPGYLRANMPDYFDIRYNDPMPFYAISDRMLFDRLELVESEIYLNGAKTAEGYKAVPGGVYRGDCYICLFTHRLNRNFNDPTSPTNDLIVDRDCWRAYYEVDNGAIKTEKFLDINLGDLNSILMGMYITTWVRSTYNLNIRSLDDSIPDEDGMFGHPKGFYPYFPISNRGAFKRAEALCYNKGFSVSTSEKVYQSNGDIPWVKNEYSNRIAYSAILVKDAFNNGWRIFPKLYYRDYPKTYGSITKLVEFKGTLFCVFEHGVGLIPVNERAVAGEGAGGYAYINTNNVLPLNPNILSTTYGSLWRDSVVITPNYIYGVDTVAKKIWRTNGNAVQCISDFKIQEFLNKNISLEERELTPTLGIRNVKSHYNAFKLDIMFTFYDNTYGFEEKVWNICYNELLDKWVTFYSWVPSFSSNIDNLFFTFNRDTLKWIAKLGASKHGSNWANGITVNDPILKLENDLFKNLELYLDGRYVNTSNVLYLPKFKVEHDNFGNYNLFKVEKDDIWYYKLKGDNNIYKLSTGQQIVDKDGNPITDYTQVDKIFQKLLCIAKKPIEDLCTEIYERSVGDNNYFLKEDGNYNLDNKHAWSKELTEAWVESVKKGNGKVVKTENGMKKYLPKTILHNPHKIVTLLNVSVEVYKIEKGKPVSLDQAISSGDSEKLLTSEAYFQSTIALCPEYNMLFLTTDFWKHGQAGIIDIKDPITPTYWYGKLHPFELEFVVADKPGQHKIFNSLLILSNKAEPESFHYEIIGECYDFAKDKKNMYIRQEATKELYLKNGMDVVFDHTYVKLQEEPRQLPNNPDSKYYDKSTIFPLYYYRLDTINEIEDTYLNYNPGDDKDYILLAGAEIVHYDTLNEYRIWNHVPAVNMAKHSLGILRGNMQYKEDLWQVLINPINIIQLNETTDMWNYNGKLKVPIIANILPPNKMISTKLERDRNIRTWDNAESINQQVKLKDKFMKVRIRYTGNDLAIIAGVLTLYSLSYS